VTAKPGARTKVVSPVGFKVGPQDWKVTPNQNNHQKSPSNINSSHNDICTYSFRSTRSVSLFFASKTQSPHQQLHPLSAHCLTSSAATPCAKSSYSFDKAEQLSANLTISIVASPASTQTTTGSQQRRRRTSSAAQPPPALNLGDQRSNDRLGASSGLPTSGYAQPLPSIPGTPFGTMSLSRSPSPRRGGGWSSPGLTSPFDNVSGKSSPRKTYGDVQMNGSAGASGDSVTWASAKARSEEVNGYPSFSTRNNGFFSRHARKISTSLPTFSMGGRRDFSDKEKLGRGRWPPIQGSRTGRFLTYTGRIIWRLRLRLGIVLSLILAVILFYATREFHMIPDLVQALTTWQPHTGGTEEHPGSVVAANSSSY